MGTSAVGCCENAAGARNVRPDLVRPVGAPGALTTGIVPEMSVQLTSSVPGWRSTGRGVQRRMWLQNFSWIGNGP